MVVRSSIQNPPTQKSSLSLSHRISSLSLVSLSSAFKALRVHALTRRHRRIERERERRAMLLSAPCLSSRGVALGSKETRRGTDENGGFLSSSSSSSFRRHATGRRCAKRVVLFLSRRRRCRRNTHHRGKEERDEGKEDERRRDDVLAFHCHDDEATPTGATMRSRPTPAPSSSTMKRTTAQEENDKLCRERW